MFYLKVDADCFVQGLEAGACHIVHVVSTSDLLTQAYADAFTGGTSHPAHNL
jgi:hypothetical protein